MKDGKKEYDWEVRPFTNDATDIGFEDGFALWFNNGLVRLSPHYRTCDSIEFDSREQINVLIEQLEKAKDAF